MSHKVIRIFAIGALAVVLALVRAEDFKQVKIVKTEQVKFAAGGVIRLNHSYGDLYIEGWDQPEVEITTIRSMPFNYDVQHPERAGQQAEKISVVTEHPSETELTISTSAPPRKHFYSPPLPASTRAGVTVAYELKVPRQSRLVIQHGIGMVFVNNVDGDISATVSRGDVLLALPSAGAYAIDAKSKFGTVSSDFEGTTHLARYRLGEGFTTPAQTDARRIYVRAGFGGVIIKGILPESDPRP